MELFNNGTDELELQGLENLEGVTDESAPLELDASGEQAPSGEKLNIDELQDSLEPFKNTKDDLAIDDDGALDVTALSVIDETDESVSADTEAADCDKIAEQSDDREGTTEKKSEPREDMLYEDTVQLMQSGEIDVADGIKLLKRAAEQGCDRSWLYLGQLYSHKKSALYNPALAFDCYKSAAELGSGDGYYNLGLCYSRGFGCEVDEESAVESFADGAREFHPDCICALGMCYEFGLGCNINYEYAVILYRKGMELESAISANNLGGCYFYGHGVAQDKEEALRLFSCAAELGNSNAECRLGICKQNGDGCEKDEAGAFEHFKKAAEANNATALYNLARCCDQGLGTEQNFNQAFKYYERSAKLGYPPAKYEAGKMRMTGHGTKKNPDTAYQLLASAVRDGYAPAEYEVANCFFEGNGAVRNRNNAYLHYLKAYETDELNKADAAYRLGVCNLKGLGTGKNEGLAFEWFERGSQLGSPDALYMLGECYYYGVGTAQNDFLAAATYLQAIEQIDEKNITDEKHASLLLAIAQCYEHGRGVDKDAVKAMSFYKKAADTGNDEAMFRTGQAIITGIGMRAEYAASRTYFLRAARHGYMPAMLSMGIFSEEGRGIKKNRADARSWYVKAVSAESEPHISLFDFPERFAESTKLYMDSKIKAQYRLGMLTAHYNATASDYIKAFEYIAIAAAMGYDPARVEIAKIHKSGGDLKEYYEGVGASVVNTAGEGVDFNVNAAEIALAMDKLGDAFFDGKNLLKKNDTYAARCYKFAAEQGNIEAIYSYGWCLRHGVGVNENDAEAVKWLKIAADRGNSNAAYSYGLCCEEGAATGIRNKREALYYYRAAAMSGHLEAAQRYMMLSERDE
jgi:TPR repeat protein